MGRFDGALDLSHRDAETPVIRAASDPKPAAGGPRIDPVDRVGAVDEELLRIQTLGRLDRAGDVGSVDQAPLGVGARVDQVGEHRR